MPTVTLRPDGLVSGYSINPALLADNSDATWDNPAVFNSSVLSMTTFAFPAGSVIQNVKLRGRIQTNNTGSGHTLNVDATINAAVSQLARLTSSFDPIQTIASSTKTNQGNGAAWTQAAIDGVTVTIPGGGEDAAAPGNFDGIKYYEIYLDVVYNQTAVISGVTVAAQLREDVPITWTFTDAESDTQTGFEVKIFTSDVVAAGGFDPSTSAYVFTSGFVSSAATSYQANANLSPGYYRAYVRAQDTGTDQYTNWASSSEFRIINSPLMVM